MASRLQSKVITYGALAAALLALSACADFSKLFQKPATKSQTSAKTQAYSTTEFATSLSVADIALSNGSSLADVADETKIIEAFTKRKKSKSATLTVAVLEYSDKAGVTRKSAGVISEQGGMEGLTQVLSQLGAVSHTLKDVRVAKVTVAPGIAFVLKGRDDATIKQDIASRAGAIADNGRKLGAAEEAKLQIRLLKYFIGAQNRDAAYICADNAKRLLLAVHNSGDHAAADQLTQDLSTAEGDLHKKMPY